MSRLAQTVTIRSGAQERHRITLDVEAVPALELGKGRAAGTAEGRLAVAEPGAQGFGVLLRQLRDEAGLTQDELAEAARVSQRAISDLERGVNRTARKDTAVLLADALSLAGHARELFVAAARGRMSVAEALPRLRDDRASGSA